MLIKDGQKFYYIYNIFVHHDLHPKFLQPWSLPYTYTFESFLLKSMAILILQMLNGFVVLRSNLEYPLKD